MKSIRSTERFHKGLNIFFIFIAVFLFYTIATATTPNPGHAWSEVGDGTFAVTGPSALRTFTFPDANATVLTSNAPVTVAQGGTGLNGTTINQLLYSSAANTIDELATANNGVLVTNGSGVPSIATDLPSGVTQGGSAIYRAGGTDVALADGGTGTALSASNGGIIYSGASSLAILGGTATAGQILQSGASTAPTWSTATYPATAGTSGNVLTSNGTNWSSSNPGTITTVVTRPALATGAIAGVGVSSLTSRKTGLFNVPQKITVNQLTYNTTAITTAGTVKFCVYSEDGATKLIDVTSTPSGTIGPNSVSVSAVQLLPGNYYIATGCATTCSLSLSTWTTTALATINGASVPAGKKVSEGNVTHTSGTCNSTLGTITGATSGVPTVRLDN